MALRFATFTLALALSVPAAAQTGKSPPAGDISTDRTTIEADVIEGVSDLEVSARGNAEISREDMSIFGDQLRYNREFGYAEGDGGVRLQRGADRFFGPSLQYNVLDDTGAFESPQYLLERERTARGRADRLEFLGRERYRFTNATYTTCRPGQEDWRMEASELELDFEEEEGTARAPRLRFFDVPILAAPGAVFPIGDRRRSGLLTPYYAQTSTRGFEFGIPYYWNIAPEYDATFTPVYMAAAADDGRRSAPLVRRGARARGDARGREGRGARDAAARRDRREGAGEGRRRGRREARRGDRDRARSERAEGSRGADEVGAHRVDQALAARGEDA
jgi:lipopolysaccharide assembly outer membrane protein LptD (OstA)